MDMLKYSFPAPFLQSYQQSDMTGKLKAKHSKLTHPKCPCHFMADRAMAGRAPCRASADRAPCRVTVGRAPGRATVGRTPWRATVGRAPCRAMVGRAPCRAMAGRAPCRAMAGRAPCRATGSAELFSSPSSTHQLI
jgi:hypothetical protein